MKTVQQLLNQHIDTYTESVERELLVAMMTNMQDLQLNVNRAQKIAKTFLQQYPYQDKEVILSVLKKMGEEYPEARNVYMKCANEYYQEKANVSMQIAQEYVKNGNLDEAVATLKGGDYHG